MAFLGEVALMSKFDSVVAMASASRGLDGEARRQVVMSSTTRFLRSGREARYFWVSQFSRVAAKAGGFQAVGHRAGVFAKPGGGCLFGAGMALEHGHLEQGRGVGIVPLTPRPLAYIQPRLYMASALPRPTASQ